MDRVGVGVGVLGTAGDLIARKMLVSMTFVYNKVNIAAIIPTDLTELVELVRERMDLSITGKQRREDYEEGCV